MTKLYEISQEFNEVAKLADSEEMKEAVADTLEAIEAEFNDKAQALTSVMLNMDGDIKAIDNEIERLKARKSSIENRQNEMKNYLRNNMERCDISKITCPLFTINCVKGREVAVIDDESAIPLDFVNVETKIKPKKNDIAKALKGGEAVPGARLERTKSSIRIK